MGNALIWTKRPQELPCNIPEQKGNRGDKEYIGVRLLSKCSED